MKKFKNNINKNFADGLFLKSAKLFHLRWSKTDLRNFAIFTEKHPCWSLFNKVAGLKTCNSNTGVFM